METLKQLEFDILGKLQRSGGELTRAELRFQVSLPNDMVESAIDDMERRGLIEIRPTEETELELIAAKE